MTRIALILSGGVSLGSYVAGAVREIVLALERNRRPGVTIDVIAGASAGSVTGAILARAIAVNPSLLPWLEKLWVDLLDVSHLLDSGRPDRTALIDSRVIEEISRVLITAEAATDDAPSSVAGQALRVGMTLSNVGGVPFDFRPGLLDPPDRFYGSRVHKDWIQLELAPGTAPDDPVWERLRLSALASSAFPFAFAPQSMDRPLSDYPSADFDETTGDPVRMWYVDGGMFSNEPVGLARRLVASIPNHRESDWKYILVDPYMEADRGQGAAPPAPPTTPGRLASQLALAVMEEGASGDWREAQKVNARLQVLERLVTRLPDFGERLTDPDALELGHAIGDLAEDVAEMKVKVRGGTEVHAGDPEVEYLRENIGRIEADHRYTPALDRAETRAARTRMAKLIFVLEAAGGLRDKGVLDLSLVAPARTGELSGDFLGNFGGFLSREWRANDFRAGRRDARRTLETVERLSEVIEYEPDPPASYEVRELEGSFETMPAASRDHVRSFVEDEADRLLADFGPGGLLGLLGPLWKPRARDAVADRIMSSLARMDREP